MDKKIIFLFAISVMIFVVVAFSINIIIKKYSTERDVPQSESQEYINPEVTLIEKEESPQFEYPETEPPLEPGEPLLQ